MNRNMQALFMDEDDQLVSFAPRKQKIQKLAREADKDMLDRKRKQKIRDRGRHNKTQPEFA